MNDRLNLETWEQQVEYRKVHQWGCDFNRTKFKEETAQEMIDD